jgi:hypothetical protein
MAMISSIRVPCSKSQFITGVQSMSILPAPILTK